MAKSKYYQKQQEQKLSDEETPEKKVKMLFSEPKFYNDLHKPIFEAGKVYELEGAAWIERWKKRGGQVVEDTAGMPEAEQEDGPSTAKLAQENDRKRNAAKAHSGVSANLKTPEASDKSQKTGETVSHEDNTLTSENLGDTKEDTDNL